MRKSIEYRDHEIAVGMTILWHGESLYVREVIYRRGRGLELHTRRTDDYCGPTIYPHPDESVKVLAGTAPEVEWHNTLDYPHARILA